MCRRRFPLTRAVTSVVDTSQPITLATITNIRVLTTTSADNATKWSHATRFLVKPARFTADTMNHERDGRCMKYRVVDPLPKLGVFKCVRLPDTQSQKRHHNVTSQNDVSRTEQNRLGM